MIYPTGTLYDLAADTALGADALMAEATRRAGVLHARGLSGADGIFVIAHANSASFFADLFAVWMIGGCAACVNSGLVASELARVVAFTGARAVLCDTGGTECGGICLETATEVATPPMREEPDNPALILFTSGTTGDPKGVVQTFRSIATRLSLNADHIGGDMARTLCTLPTHFGHGLIGNCLTPLCHGADVFIGAGAGLSLATALSDLIETHKITFLSSVPSFWKLATRISPSPQGGSLTRIHIGSAQLSREVWQEVIDWSGGAAVVNMYGTTETANWIGGASSRDHAPEDGLLGTAWGGEFGVMTDTGEITAQGMGEIVVRTPSIMQGYHLRPDLTADVMRDGWYFTGDMGGIDDEGIVRLTGRKRYMINVAGTKIYPEELDLLFERHDHIAEACAFGIDDPVSGEVVGVAAVLTPDAPATPKELTDWARGQIRPDAVPHRIFILDDIPKSPRGKVNRAHVAAQCLRGLA